MKSASTMTAAIATAHNYHDWIYRSFAPFLRPGSALEIGSGHGEFSRRMSQRLDHVLVSDIDPAAIERIRVALRAYHNIDYVVMNGVDPGILGRKVDNIVLLNVLEHIEDEKSFLARCRDSLTPGGALIVFVPAFGFLYSRMDREAGHFRRYGKRQLSQIIERSGFLLSHLGFINAVGFFGWLANKWMDTSLNSASSNLQVSLYDRMIPLFRRVDRVLPFFGQSLLAVATAC